MEQRLTARELNRATLARQMLLERVPLDPASAIERLAALQAQERASPYLALWARLADYRAEQLDRAFLERRVVKATLMRVTLHAVSAADHAYFWAALAESHRLFRGRVARWSLDGLPVDEIAERALAFASQPRTNTEMRRFLDELGGPIGDRDLWWGIRTHVPFIVTPTGATWSFDRRPAFVAARAWLGHQLANPEHGLDHLLLRYLAAFGPATVGDISQFTHIARSRLKPALERLAGRLRTFRSESGRQPLYDVLEGALPPADTPAPPRFLPMWDSILLAYEDRSRVIPERHRRRIVQVNGDFLPTFLVDGIAAGLWRAEVVDGRTRVSWQPFEPLPAAVELQVAEEAERLAAFVEPIEPDVYRRYAGRWMTERSAAPVT